MDEEYHFSAPGRVEIGGNHTDHQHGRVLAAAINLESKAIVRRNCEGKIRVISEGYEPVEIDVWDLGVHEEEKNTTAALIRGVASAFTECGCKLGGLDAKIVSPVAIIVVALAGIAGYTLPNQELGNAVRLLRLALVLAAALAGLFGILAMLGLVIWYLCTIDSDGVAYMAPFVDSERPALWRTLLRRPQPDNKFRPPEYGSENRRRQR